MESGHRQSAASSQGAFSSTEYTLLGRLLDMGEDGRREATNHVMDVYARPLAVYFLGSGFAKDNLEADDVVRGFFADRLYRPEFLDDWFASRRRLRYWLITAFKHYLHEQRYVQSRQERREHPLDEVGDDKHGGQSPEQAFHREVALAIVKRCLDRASASCAESGHESHWNAMLRHHLDGRTFDELSEEYGIDAPRLKVMARTATNRFRRCLREELAWPGSHPEDIDREIRSLMEVLHS